MARRRLTKEWYARMQFRGKREFFSLGTPNKAAAAAKARDIYLALVASGWEATLARFKKPSAAKRALNAGQSCTVGEFLEAIAGRRLIKHSGRLCTSLPSNCLRDLRPFKQQAEVRLPV